MGALPQRPLKVRLGCQDCSTLLLVTNRHHSTCPQSEAACSASVSASSIQCPPQRCAAAVRCPAWGCATLYSLPAPQARLGKGVRVACRVRHGRRQQPPWVCVLSWEPRLPACRSPAGAGLGALGVAGRTPRRLSTRCSDLRHMRGSDRGPGQRRGTRRLGAAVRQARRRLWADACRRGQLCGGCRPRLMRVSRARRRCNSTSAAAAPGEPISLLPALSARAIVSAGRPGVSQCAQAQAPRASWGRLGAGSDGPVLAWLSCRF